MKLGIDMGGMSIKMGLVNEENKIIGRITIPTDLTVPYQTLVERMADAVRQMLENAGMTLEQCGGIGIGSPGTIDAKQGVILYSNNFGWENVPIVEELKKRGREDILVCIGGVIPAQDYQYLYDHGAQAIFGPGTNIPECCIKLLHMLVDRAEAEAKEG